MFFGRCLIFHIFFHFERVSASEWRESCCLESQFFLVRMQQLQKRRFITTSFLKNALRTFLKIVQAGVEPEIKDPRFYSTQTQVFVYFLSQAAP